MTSKWTAERIPDLTGKIAIVTGANSGIGYEAAVALARKGAQTILACRSKVRGEAALQKIQGGDPQARVELLLLDLSDLASIRSFADVFAGRYSKLDILINNAGITRDNLLIRMKENDWDAVISVNLKGTYNCIKAFSRTMLKQREGSIVNISSIVGLMGNPGQVNYSASKAGIIGLTKSVAKEFAGRNINVNAVAPGFIATEMTDKLPEETKNSYKAAIPLGRFGSTEDVANLVLFLSSDISAYITGEVIKVDGGQYI